MHFRSTLWPLLFALVVALPLWAQAPAREPGVIVVAKVTGSVSKVFEGVTTQLQVNDRVEEGAKVVTAKASSVVLFFVTVLVPNSVRIPNS
jgi:hypothetical protein